MKKRKKFFFFCGWPFFRKDLSLVFVVITYQIKKIIGICWEPCWTSSYIFDISIHTYTSYYFFKRIIWQLIEIEIDMKEKMNLVKIRIDHLCHKYDLWHFPLFSSQKGAKARLKSSIFLLIGEFLPICIANGDFFTALQSL